MLYYIKEANSMLRFMNFKKRRKRKYEQKKPFPDCVGLHVSDIRIITSPHSSNGFCKFCRNSLMRYDIINQVIL